MSRLIDADALEFTHLLVRSLDDGHNWHELCVTKEDIDNAPTIERPQGESVIKCKDCKYQIKEWREDRRMKDKGCWIYGCKHFGELMGYWVFGGNDNEFCSDAEHREELEEAENES